MCAIIDANVTFEVFGTKRTEAGVRFRDWLDGGRGRLVVGGRNLEELTRNRNFERWFREERRRGGGRVRQTRNEIISERQQALVRDGLPTSDDEHVLALALVSGARFLYTNDRKLKNDFLNAEIIREPEGKVYTTHHGGRRITRFTNEHEELLRTENLCGDVPPD